MSNPELVEKTDKESMNAEEEEKNSMSDEILAKKSSTPDKQSILFKISEQVNKECIGDGNTLERSTPAGGSLSEMLCDEDQAVITICNNVYLLFEGRKVISEETASKIHDIYYKERIQDTPDSNSLASLEKGKAAGLHLKDGMDQETE